MKSKIIYHCSICNQSKEVESNSAKPLSTPYCCEQRMLRTVNGD